MATAPAGVAPAPGSSHGSPGRQRLVLAAILAGALGLRLWGLRQGLPYVYNVDELGHFVPIAAKLTTSELNPHYFVNPPAYTYLLHVLFVIAWGGAAGVRHQLSVHPAAVFTLARVATALLGTLAVWLLYLVGQRLFDRRVGLLAAALLAVAFLPVHYSHLALNDVPTLVPLTLSLLGSAGILRRGRPLDYLLAGVGLGLGCATKYTAGIVLVVLLAAVLVRYREGPPPPQRRALARGLLLAGLAALAAFVIANPYAVLDYSSFHAELVHQSSVAGEAQGKLGAPRQSGIFYYLWSFTWGLGWIPALAALGGAVAVWRRDRRLGWLLVPAPLLFLVFMGLQQRYFGRWIMPILPIACLLAACFAASLVELVPGRRLRWALGALAAVALCAQGLVHSVHTDAVLARADTRNLTRAWLVAHVPIGSRIVVEPVVYQQWVSDSGHPLPQTATGARWVKYPSLRSLLAPDGSLDPRHSHVVKVEDYERTLSPALLSHYTSQGYCWVITGSTQSGRAFADPRAVPLAVAYYRALARQGQVVYHVSPYSAGAPAVPFNFDWSFDYYPLAYHRPGPEMTVFRLYRGRCQR